MSTTTHPSIPTARHQVVKRQRGTDGKWFTRSRRNFADAVTARAYAVSFAAEQERVGGTEITLNGVPIVRCRCGDITGERCAAMIPRTETVWVEYMPEQHRAGHEAAGNCGSYPHNGSIRVRCDRVCAVALADEWTEIAS